MSHVTRGDPGVLESVYPDPSWPRLYQHAMDISPCRYKPSHQAWCKLANYSTMRNPGNIAKCLTSQC